MDFAEINDLVRQCERRPRYAQVFISGGEGSGKTRGALELAAGLRAADAGIVLLSLGEAHAEEFFAGVVPFAHIGATPELHKRAVDGGVRRRWPFPNDPVGLDPRVVVFTLERLLAGVGPGGVVVIDTLSEVWDAAKAAVDDMASSPNQKGAAWQKMDRVLDAFWTLIDEAPCHVILCIRSKVEVETEERRGRRSRVHTPTVPEMRARDMFRGTIRIYLDSNHVARFASKLDELEGRVEEHLTRELGAEIKRLLGGEPWEATGNARLAEVAQAVGLQPAVLGWCLAARQAAKGTDNASPAAVTKSVGLASNAVWKRRVPSLVQEIGDLAKRQADAGALIEGHLEEAQAVAAELGLWDSDEPWPPGWPVGAMEGLALAVAAGDEDSPSPSEPAAPSDASGQTDGGAA